MMNKLYKPVLSLSRVFYRCALNSQIVQNAPQKVFSERILFDIRQIENIWRRSKDSNVFHKFLYKCYVQNSEVLTYAVDIIHFASNRSKSSPANLVFEMVKTFSNYIEENNLSVSPSYEQQICVLSSVLNFKSYQVVQLVCQVFKLHDQPLAFKQFIKNLIQEQKFFEAAYLVSALHLQKEFDIKEILLPLLVEGNTYVSAIYMTNHPDIQLKVAKFLDGFLNTTATDIHLKPKKVFKTLSSVINMFKIPIDNCPNFQFIRSKGAINILSKRRDQQSVSETTFEEMIKSIVRDNEDLKKFLIQKLVNKKDWKTATKMSEIFNISIPDMHLSESANEIKENSSIVDCDQSEDSDDCDSQNFDIYDASDEYLKFSLKAEDIKVINNKEDFVNCIDDIYQNYKMVGIDSEWKPHFGLSRDRLALIQLAVDDKVYILDLLLLSECLDAEHWDKLLDDIFGNPNLIKLGCGIMSDVNMILESIKGTNGKAVKFSHILDMPLFFEKLHDVYPVEMHSYSDKSFTRGLSSLCEIILGKPLNKEDRLCDWEKRPLMEKQLEYAALDAHCLLQIYDKLKEDSVKKDMNFQHLVKVAIVVTTSQWKPKRKYKGVKSCQAFHVHSSVPVEQLKIVMDSVFENQAIELRKLGADVVILKDCNSADAAVELSKNEGRTVVCSEQLYSQIKHRVKQGFCYFFPSAKEDQIQVTHFLQYFNAQVSTKSIFSRCLSCNSNHGMKLSAEDLKILHELNKTHTSMNSVLQENLSSFSSELQTTLSDVLNSGITINLLMQGNSSSLNDYAFLCKSCGNIS